MAAKQCPHCLMWVNDEERLSGQCPGCQSFFESEIPQSRSTPSPSVTGAPTIRTESTSSSSRRRNSSGAWSAWWLIPIVWFGLRGCTALMRMNDRHSSPYDYNGQSYEPPDVDPEEIRRLIESMQQHQEEGEPLAYPPGDDASEFGPPKLVPEEQVFEYPTASSDDAASPPFSQEFEGPE